FKIVRPADALWIGIEKAIQNCFTPLFVQSRMRRIEAHQLRIVEADHAGNVGFQFGNAGVISPGIASGQDALREVIKQFGSITSLVTQDDEPVKAVIALFEPVAMLIGSDNLPVGYACHADAAGD